MSNTGTSDQSFELRLRQVEDVVAVRDLKARYWSALDRLQLETVRTCLTADARIDMEGVACHTRDEFIDYIQRASGRAGLFNLHAGQNPRISVTATDSAEGNWDVLFTSVDVGARLTIQMTGEYIDTYVRRDGRWYIDSLVFRQTSFLMQQIDERGVPRVLSMGRSNEDAFKA
jgi:hypothetical protein